MKSEILLAAAVCALAPSATAALPPLTIPQGVGVNIHFTRGHEADLDLIAAAGFKFIRMDFAWGGIERDRGVFDWSAYEELTGNLEKRGLSAIYILDYSNSLYEEAVASKNPITGQQHRDTASPQHPESVAAFARWAAAAARHFQGRPILWEIWNEPNISFWKPKPDVTQYTTLALATCQAIHEADPDALVIGPATSGVPLDFLDAFFKSGVLKDLAAVSVHPYRNYSRPPETAAEDYEKLRALIVQHAPAEKRNLPIISGEWGYASHAKGVSLDTQAAYLLRQQLANLLAGVPISIWYDWKNDGTDPAEREHHFGTVTHALQPKPAYIAVQTLTRELAGYSISRRVVTASERDFVLLLANSAGEEKLAAWTLEPSSRVSLRISNPGQTFRLVAWDGVGSELATAADAITLNLGPGPIYAALSPARLVP